MSTTVLQSICSTRPREGQDHSDYSYTIFKKQQTVSHHLIDILRIEKEKDDSQSKEIGGERGIRLVQKI